MPKKVVTRFSGALRRKVDVHLFLTKVVEVICVSLADENEETGEMRQCVTFLDSLPFSDFYEITMCNRTRASHDYRLYIKIAISNCDIYSFFVRIVNVCNNSLNYDMQITFLILFFSFQIFFSVYNVLLHSRFYICSLLFWGVFYIGITSRYPLSRDILFCFLSL